MSFAPKVSKVTDSGPGRGRRVISLSEEGRKNWDRIFSVPVERKPYGARGILGCYPGWLIRDYGDKGRVN